MAKPPDHVDKIRKLLELARSAGETAEGRSAKQKADDRMRAMGLTEAEVLSDRKVAMDGRAEIWEQALMEACADLDGCRLEVDRAAQVWTLKGSRKSASAAADRFDGLRRQLRREAASYIQTVREGMIRVGDDPSTARSVLERMRRVFLESAAVSVVIRVLERILAASAAAAAAEEGEGPADGPDQGFEVPKEDTSRKKQPFEKLTERFEMGSEVDWDLEIDVPDGTLDPSTAGHGVGSRARLDPPWGDELQIEKERQDQIRTRMITG